MAVKNGDVLVLTAEDITEGMLNGLTIDIPAGCTRLIVRESDRVELNAAMGLDDDPGDGYS